MTTKEWYEMKRDQYYNAYMAALETEEVKKAEKLFVEYENYKRMANS